MFYDPPDTRKDYTGIEFSYEPATWQACPICKGSGKIKEVPNTKTINYADCSTCDGHGIINKLTGKPPSDE